MSERKKEKAGTYYEIKVMCNNCMDVMFMHVKRKQTLRTTPCEVCGCKQLKPYGENCAKSTFKGRYARN